MKDDRFEVSFRNPIIRMWFYTILPTMIISAILFLVLPIESHLIIRNVGYVILIGYCIWVFLYKRKNRNSDNN